MNTRMIRLIHHLPWLLNLQSQGPTARTNRFDGPQPYSVTPTDTTFPLFFFSIVGYLSFHLIFPMHPAVGVLDFL